MGNMSISSTRVDPDSATVPANIRLVDEHTSAKIWLFSPAMSVLLLQSDLHI